nr:hypothetical protein [Ectobacillus panaciterrae]
MIDTSQDKDKFHHDFPYNLEQKEGAVHVVSKKPKKVPSAKTT